MWKSSIMGRQESPLNLLQQYLEINQSISKIAQFPTSELILQSFPSRHTKTGRECVASWVHIDPNPSSLNHPFIQQTIIMRWLMMINCLSTHQLQSLHVWIHSIMYSSFLSQLSLRRSLAWLNCSRSSAKTLLGI